MLLPLEPRVKILWYSENWRLVGPHNASGCFAGHINDLPLQEIALQFHVHTAHRLVTGARCGVVVEALRYKPAGRGFDSRWFHWNFSVT
jgi:hypothetical protein